MTYAKHFKKVATPVSQPLAGKAMVRNADGGGYAFKIGDWQRLQRFLMLGSEGGTYYEGEKQLTLANAAVVQRCLKADFGRTLGEIVAVSDKGLAPSNSPAIFALALACLDEDEFNRGHAFTYLGKVCRIGTHLFEFMDTYVTLKGSKSLGRMARRNVGNWYTSKTPQNLAYSLIKYQQRDGWSNRDVLRLAHPASPDLENSFVLGWAVGKTSVTPNLEDHGGTGGLRLIAAFEQAKSADKKTLVKLITDYNLPREAVPTQMLNEPAVWYAMLPSMGYTAILRNLPKMTELGMFEAFQPGKAIVMGKLMDAGFIKKSRVHPLALLQALKTYQSGVSVRGSKTWIASQDIVSALDAAFYLSFDNVEPLDKNVLVAIDCSGSMTYAVAGITNLSAREAGLAMALVYKKQNPKAEIVAFSSHLSEVPWLHAGMRLDDALRQFERHVIAEGTDLSLPFEYALKRNWNIDGVLMITDGEGNMGGHAAEVKERLAKKLGHSVKWVLIQATASATSTQDTGDMDSFEFAGFSANMVNIANEFFRGNL